MPSKPTPQYHVIVVDKSRIHYVMPAAVILGVVSGLLCAGVYYLGTLLSA